MAKKKTPPPRGTPLTPWPKCDQDPPNTWRYFVNRETQRSLCLRKFETAVDVMSSPSWSTESQSDKRTFTTAEACTRFYLEFYEHLRQEGWLQFVAAEHATELRAHAAIR